MQEKLDTLVKRAKFVYNHPSYFKRFEREEVGVLTDLFVPDMFVVSYIIWGVSHDGGRYRVCLLDEKEKKKDYEKRTGQCPLK